METKSTRGVGRVLHPMIKSRNSKGLVLAGPELTLVCMLVLWQGWVERGKRASDWKQTPGKEVFQAGVRQGLQPLAPSHHSQALMQGWLEQGISSWLHYKALLAGEEASAIPSCVQE